MRGPFFSTVPLSLFKSSVRVVDGQAFCVGWICQKFSHTRLILHSIMKSRKGRVLSQAIPTLVMGDPDGAALIEDLKRLEVGDAGLCSARKESLFNFPATAVKEGARH